MASRLASLGLCAALVAACGPAGAPAASTTAPAAAANAIPSPTAATPAPTAAGNAMAGILGRGRLVAAVKREESPRGVNLDVAHFQKRNFEIGIAGAIAHKILGDASKVELLVVTKPDRIPAVTSGRADLLISMIPVTAANQALLDFSEPYATGGVTFITKAGAKLLIIPDLEGKRVAIAMQERDEIESELQAIAYQYYVSITTQTCPSFAECADGVRAGTYDAVLSNSINVSVLMQANPGVFDAGSLLWPEAYGVGVPKGNPQLLEAINSVIANLKASGELAALATKVGFPTPAR